MSPRRLHSKLALLLSSLLALNCGGEYPEQGEEFGTTSAALTAITSFGSNPGNAKMFTHVPAGMPANAPLVVAMPGCVMSGPDYVKAGWSDLADQWKFYVVYPEDSSGMRCFPWFDLSQSRRGAGAAASIKQMVDYMKAHYSIDSSRVFVTGLSAGGGFTSVMMAAYPDVFAAGATMAGLPYRCADSTADTGSCMGSGKQLSANAWGDLVRNAYPGYQGPYPRLSVWHGATDGTVSPKNLPELMKQWTNVQGIDQTADATGRVKTASRTEYRDAAGRTLVETWLVDKMGHGTAVEPGLAAAGGCGSAGAFVLSAGICSTYYSALFFGLEPHSGAVDAGTPATPDASVPTPPDAGVEAPDAGTEQPDASVLVPDAGAPEEVVDAGTPGPTVSCSEWNTSNYHHVLAGRAVRCGSYQGYACAKGSGEKLGLWSLGIKSWVREVPAGYYEAGQCGQRSSAAPPTAIVETSGAEAQTPTPVYGADQPHAQPSPTGTPFTAPPPGQPGAQDIEAGPAVGCSAGGFSPMFLGAFLLWPLRRRTRRL